MFENHTQEKASSHERDFVIRAARPADAAIAATLIHLPMGRLADYLFGNDDPAYAIATLGVNQPTNSRAG